MLSSGAKRDLLVLSFAKSMIEVSKSEDARSDENLAPRIDNKDYHINKRIDNNLERIAIKINETLDSLYAEGGMEVAKWVKNNLSKRIGGTLTKIQAERINLEMLAIWVLYVNFADVKRNLHDKFQWLTNGSEWLRLADMMEETKISNLQGNMFQTAYDVVERIKS